MTTATLKWVKRSASAAAVAMIATFVLPPSAALADVDAHKYKFDLARKCDAHIYLFEKARPGELSGSGSYSCDNHYLVGGPNNKPYLRVSVFKNGVEVEKAKKEISGKWDHDSLSAFTVNPSGKQKWKAQLEISAANGTVTVTTAEITA